MMARQVPRALASTTFQTSSFGVIVLVRIGGGALGNFQWAKVMFSERKNRADHPETGSHDASHWG